MYTYMEYLQKCFYKATGWAEDNMFASLTGSSQAILDFGVPSGAKVDVSSKTTDFSASSFTLSNHNVINGSLAYLYSSAPLAHTVGTNAVSLQEAISGFKVIEPLHHFEAHARPGPDSLLYGRMYFPGSALEAMVIKKFSPHTQLLVKSISNPNVAKNGTMIVYLQHNTPKLSREFVYSTNEALLGFRCLYNFGTRPAAASIMPKFDNSVVSVGTEIWYAAMTMSPGLSTAFRYSTRSTTTGKPLTMTLAVNPILGQLSSTYTVKTSVASTFSSKYDFNFYSYQSNLSLGFELYNYQKSAPQVEPIDVPYTGHNLELQRHRESVMSAFQHLVNESDFSSVLKLSTSINDRMVKLLWEGRVKDFLVSTGVQVGVGQAPELAKFGVSLSYAN